MKTDLLTAVTVAIVGGLIGFFVCNLLIPPIEDVKFTTIDGSVSTDVAAPSEDIFNVDAINPTVEVYVGEDE